MLYLFVFYLKMKDILGECNAIDYLRYNSDGGNNAPFQPPLKIQEIKQQTF